MTVVITMAGSGSRFRESGFSVPKYRIIANKKSLFQWSMKSLSNFFDQKFIFACLSDVDQYWLESELELIGISNYSVVMRNSVSSGQAETAYDAVKRLCSSEKKAPLWIFNIDTYIHAGMSPDHLGANDGTIYVCDGDSDNLSYVQINTNNQVTKVAEKQKISNWASVGMYGFSSIEKFEELYNKAYLEQGVALVNGEKYVMPVYSIALDENNIVSARILNKNYVTVLGTPEELLAFDNTATAH